MHPQIDIFPWNEHFNTGLPTVDAQHRKLVELLNQLASQLAFRPDRPTLEAILDELTAYTVYHFEDEETIWAHHLAQDRQETEHHRAGHGYFIARMQALRADFAQRPLADVADSLLDFLARWLASHILESDRRMAYTVQALQTGLDLQAAKQQADALMAGSTRTLIDIILSIYGSLSSNTLRLMREIHEHKQATAARQASEHRHSQYQQLLLDLSTTFINLPLDEVDEAIHTALGQISHFTEADRAYLFRYDFEHSTATNTHEWCAPGIQPQRAHLQGVALAEFAQWVDIHRQGQPFLVESLAHLPDGVLKNLLQSQDIQSLVTLPLMNGHRCLGFVGFDAVRAPHRYSPEDLKLLRLFANLLAHLHERQHIENTLAHERGLLHTLVQTIPDLVWLKDPDGVYLACNHRFEQLYGTPQADIVGKTDRDFVTPELADFFRAKDQQAIIQGRSSTNEELLTFASDGHQELTETTKTPMYDASGQLIGVLGIGRDITERERIKQELKRRDSYQRAVLDNFPFLIWLKDDESRFLAVNTVFAQACGAASPDELVGKTDLDVWPTALAELYRADDRAVLNSGQPKNVEEPVNGPGQTGWLETFKAPVQLGGHMLGTVGFARDITERKAAEERLALAASVFTHANEGIMITAPDGTLVEVNDAFTRITGYSREEMIGRNANMLSSGRQGAEFYAGMWQALTTTGNWVGEIWNRRKNGDIYVEQLTISAVRNAQGHIIRYAGMFADITQQKAHERRLEQIAHYDALTGLPNRVLLADRLRQAMAQSVRRAEKLVLVFIDLDGFKLINDTHGHATGDKLLIALASRMSSTLREGDTLARIGGDEFVAVLIDLSTPSSAHPVLERMRLAAAQPFLIDGLELQVSASLGVVFYPQQTEMDAEQLLRQADQAMYQAKVAGKNRYHVFDTEHDRHVRGLHEDLQAVRQAMQRNEFELHYQPKVNMRTGQLVGCEALIRWHHPQRGLLNPGSFLPSLQGDVLAVELGDWVLATAMAQMQAWKTQGLHIPVSVNVDGLHLQQPNFVPKLQTLLASHPLVQPGDLELEVLESSALDDIVTVSGVMRACRSLGVEFALDDFGTGYSSLTYLRRLPASVLKIDSSFVRDLLDDPSDMAILEGVLGLARAFRTQVIAEGVETTAHGEMLLRLGCEWGQGHAIARAMPAADLKQWLNEWQVPAAWQNLNAVSSQDLPLLSAVAEHRAWVNQLTAYLQGHTAEPPDTDAHDCHFGIWLNSETTLQRYHTSQRLATIATLHGCMHAQANELIHWKQTHQYQQVQSGIFNVNRMRDELTGHLMNLLNEVATGTPPGH